MPEIDLRDGEPELIDLLHLGRPSVIGAWRVGDTIVDPGPSSCLATLLARLERDPPRAIALTHIHLDHAGASGSLVARFPDLEVWVHERGAAHLIDPSRLIDSATRLYGEQMQRLWGEVLAVPAERLRVLHGGERLGPFSVAYTPGHASHHVSYLHEPSGRAFTGDVAGVRIGAGRVLAPTPPPDIDVEAWMASIARLREWPARELAITHFGSFEAAGQLDAVERSLEIAARRSRELSADEFVAAMAADIEADPVARTADVYSLGAPLDQVYAGLERYWSKREAAQ